MTLTLKHSKLFQKIGISALIMTVILISMDYSKFTGSLGNIHINAWIFALGFIYIQILALSCRWLLLINVYEKKIDLSSSVQVNLMSIVANYLFITSVGGMIVRVAMSVKSGVSLIRSIAATVLDRFFTVATLIVSTVLFLPVFGTIVSTDIFHKTLFLMAVTFASAFIFALFLFETPRKKIIFSHRKVAMCFQYLRKVFTDKGVMGSVIVSSVLAQFSYFAAVYIIMVSMGIDFSLLYFFAVIPVITFVASLPIGYGGWGIREGAFIYGLGLINVPFETAFATSLQVGILTMGGSILASIPLFLKGRTKFNIFKPFN